MLTLQIMPGFGKMQYNYCFVQEDLHKHQLKHQLKRLHKHQLKQKHLLKQLLIQELLHKREQNL